MRYPSAPDIQQQASNAQTTQSDALYFRTSKDGANMETAQYHLKNGFGKIALNPDGSEIRFDDYSDALRVQYDMAQSGGGFVGAMSGESGDFPARMYKYRAVKVEA